MVVSSFSSFIKKSPMRVNDDCSALSLHRSMKTSQQPTDMKQQQQVPANTILTKPNSKIINYR